MSSAIKGLCVGLWIGAGLLGYQEGLNVYFLLSLFFATNLSTFLLARRLYTGGF